MDDHDGQWVLTYKDDGPNQPAPDGGWPTRSAWLFDSEAELREWFAANQEKFTHGRNRRIDMYPFRGHIKNGGTER